MTTEQILTHIQGMQAKLDDYKAWDEARSMVIDYLIKNHGLKDKYQWAYKTIELLQRNPDTTKQQAQTPQSGSQDAKPGEP